MTTELTLAEPKQIVGAGRRALAELTKLIHGRPDKVMIHGKQYLEFIDWELLGAFFGVTASVVSTEEILMEEPSTAVNGVTFKRLVGFKAKAVALKGDGHIISTAEAECMLAEDNWKDKPRFQLRSMAQTRACGKVLRNCLGWVVRLPESGFTDAGEDAEPKIVAASYQERLAIVNAATDTGIKPELVLAHIKTLYSKDGTAQLTQGEAKETLEAVRAGKLTSNKEVW